MTGEYTTKRDGGVKYTYEATWFVMPNGSAAWNAKVSKDGNLVGMPNGSILNTVGVTMEPYVRSLVETSIEIRAGIL